MKTKYPCIVHQSPTCGRWKNVLNCRKCCGNDLYMLNPHRKEIEVWLDDMEHRHESTSNFRKCDICGKWVYIINQRRCCGNYLFATKNEEQPNANKAKEKEKKKKKKHRKKLDDKLRNAVLKRDKRKCVKCGSKQGLHIHHKLPRSDGGKDEIDNLETLCELCHAEEHRGQPVYNIMIKRLFKIQTVKTS